MICGLKPPENDTKITNRDKNQLFLIIFRHKKWRNRKILAEKELIFKKAQLKCTTPRIVILKK